MTDFTPSEESQLRELVNKAFDLKGTSEMADSVDAIVDWYEGLRGRRLALRIVAGEQFRKEQESA